MSAINHLTELADQVTQFVRSKLDAGYLTNPQLTELILADTTINKPLLKVETIDDIVFQTSKEAEVKVEESLKRNSATIVIIQMKCGDAVNLEGWFYTPCFNSGGLREECIADYHYGGNRHPVLNPVSYHEKIISTMVYKAREVVNSEQRQLKVKTSLADPRIHVGAIIKNIVISSHKCSTLTIDKIITDASGETRCEVTIKKRGTRSQWTGNVCPSTILHAIIQRDKLETLSRPSPSNQTALFE